MIRCGITSATSAIWGGGAFQCIVAHQSTLDNAPPNPDYWVSIVVLRANSPNPYPFTVQGYGDAYFYWGTRDQVLDPTGEALLSAQEHPPYRGQAVLCCGSFCSERSGRRPRTFK